MQFTRNKHDLSQNKLTPKSVNYKQKKPCSARLFLYQLFTFYISSSSSSDEWLNRSSLNDTSSSIISFSSIFHHFFLIHLCVIIICIYFNRPDYFNNLCFVSYYRLYFLRFFLWHRRRFFHYRF